MTCPRPSGRRRRILLLLRLSQLIPSARAQYAAYGPRQNPMAYSGAGVMPGAMSSGQHGPGSMQAGNYGPAAGGYYPGAMQAGNYGPAAGGAYAPYTSMAWQQQPQASARRADVPHILVRTRDALHQDCVCARRRWGHRRSIQ